MKVASKKDVGNSRTLYKNAAQNKIKKLYSNDDDDDSNMAQQIFMHFF